MTKRINPNSFVPPHYGFETDSVTGTSRVFRQKSTGRSIRIYMKESPIRYHFLSKMGNLIYSYTGNLTTDEAVDILKRIEWYKDYKDTPILSSIHEKDIE